MKLLVIGAGMMGSAAAYDMARSAGVDSVTLADSNSRLAKSAAALGRACGRGEARASARGDFGSALSQANVGERVAADGVVRTRRRLRRRVAYLGCACHLGLRYSTRQH